MTSASPPRHRLSPRSTTGAGSAHLAEMTRARAGRAGSQSYASTTDWGRPAPEPVSINGHSQIGERTPLATKAEDELPDYHGPAAMWRILPGRCSPLTFVLPGPYSQGTLNTFNLRSTPAGAGYGQGQHDQGERPAGFRALGWIGGRGRIAVAPFGVAGGGPGLAVAGGVSREGAPRPPFSAVVRARGGRG